MESAGLSLPVNPPNSDSNLSFSVIGRIPAVWVQLRRHWCWDQSVAVEWTDPPLQTCHKWEEPTRRTQTLLCKEERVGRIRLTRSVPAGFQWCSTVPQGCCSPDSEFPWAKHGFPSRSVSPCGERYPAHHSDRYLKRQGVLRVSFSGLFYFMQIREWWSPAALLSTCIYWVSSVL